MFKIQKSLLASTDPLKFINDLSNEATGIYTKLGVWSDDQGLDGVVSAKALDDVNGSDEALDELLDAGLLLMVDAHYVITGWEQFQMTAAKRAAQQEATRERMRKLRERRAGKVVTPSHAAKEEDVTPSHEDVTPSHHQIKVVTPSHEEMLRRHKVEEAVTEAIEEDVLRRNEEVVTPSQEKVSVYVEDEDDFENDFDEETDTVIHLQPVTAPVGMYKAEQVQLSDSDERVLFDKLADLYPGELGGRAFSAFSRTIRAYAPEDILRAADQYDTRSPQSMGVEDFPELKAWLRDELFLDEAVFGRTK